MVKICILEDYFKETIERYSAILPCDVDGKPRPEYSHEVHLIFDSVVVPPRFRGSGIQSLVRRGVNPRNIHFDFDYVPIDAAIYFSDWLKGQCFKLAERLGRDKLYVFPANRQIREKAQQRGLKILDRPVEEIVAALEGK